jgi:hypothetical protein
MSRKRSLRASSFRTKRHDIGFHLRGFATLAIKMLSVVALLEDLPEKALVRGQVGTVVEEWTPGVNEVEFCDDSGRTYAMVALKAD